MPENPKPTRKKLLSTARFDIEQVTQQLPDGQLFSREVVRHPGAVVIIPLLSDGRICLIRNYRIAVEQELLELPAGTLEPPEPPIETARRELIEETGYRCAEIVPLCEFYMSPGMLDERMHAFVASGLTAGAAAPELGEQITNMPVTFSELDQLLRAGEIRDSKSLSALLYYLRFHAPAS